MQDQAQKIVQMLVSPPRYFRMAAPLFSEPIPRVWVGLSATTSDLLAKASG